MLLYEIDARIASLVDPETGELMDYEAFARLQMEREEKAEGLALWVKDLTARAKAVKEEADALTERQRALEARADRLKSYLDMALDGQKFQTPRCTVTFRRSSAVEVSDETALVRWLEEGGHDDCLRYKAPEVSKSAVGALLKAGVTVPGAAMVERRSVGVK